MKNGTHIIVSILLFSILAVCNTPEGMYQQRFGIEENNVPGYMSESSKLMGYEMGLPLHLKTIGDYLNPLGYKSIILGKWHLSAADRYHPLKRGFDEFYGFRGGARPFFALTQNQMAEKPENRLERGGGIRKGA